MSVKSKAFVTFQTHGGICEDKPFVFVLGKLRVAGLFMKNVKKTVMYTTLKSLCVNNAWININNIYWFKAVKMWSNYANNTLTSEVGLALHLQTIRIENDCSM